MAICPSLDSAGLKGLRLPSERNSGTAVGAGETSGAAVSGVDVASAGSSVSIVER